jgi:hypothetical protein
MLILTGRVGPSHKFLEPPAQHPREASRQMAGWPAEQPRARQGVSRAHLAHQPATAPGEETANMI